MNEFDGRNPLTAKDTNSPFTPAGGGTPADSREEIRTLTLDDLVKHFKADLLADGRLRSGVDAYAASVRHCNRFLQSCKTPLSGEIATVADFTVIGMNDFMGEMKRRRCRPRTIRGRMSAVKCFCEWLMANALLAANPCVGLALPKWDRVIRPIPTEEQIDMAILACSRLYPPRRAALARATVCVSKACGLRRTELLALKVGDINLSTGWLEVQRGKGGKYRRIPLPDPVIVALAAWKEVRGVCHHDWLWDIDHRRRLGDVGLRHLWREVVAAADMPDLTCFTPHPLRHRLATRLVTERGNIVIAADVMGHSSFLTLQQYVHGNEIAMYEARDKQWGPVKPTVEVQPQFPAQAPPAQEGKKVEEVRRFKVRRLRGG